MASSSPPLGRLRNKVAIITGSSSGIGRAIAISYVREGAKVVCADLTPSARPEIEEESVIPTHELLQQKGGDTLFLKTDVAEVGDMERLMERTVRHYGRLDIMVNNAAIVAPPKSIHECSIESWDKVMQVNTRSVFLGCKLATTVMLKQEMHESGDRGWIINVGSVAGLVGCGIVPIYSASKGAVIALTKQVAIDYASHRIHCNAITPGYVQTAILAGQSEEVMAGIASLHPFRGLGVPEDFAGPAVFLASEDARWITGVSLPVDGGFTAQ